MKSRKSVKANLTMPDQEPTQALIGKLSPEGRRRYVDLMLARDFSAFLTKVFETVSPGDVYFPNWHIDAMTYAAGRVMDGTIKRLITTVPPRHLKSIVFSVALPAFLLGRDPTNRIICVSYSGELAVKHANDFRAVMTAEWYRRVFPATKVSREKDTQYETMTTARGYRYATSLHGTLTGRGADLIVLDDPQKPDEALSEAHRNSAGQWFDTTLLSRLDSKSDGAVVIVMQRLHEDDLAGRLLEKGGWPHLKIPAIAEQDERIPIGPGRSYRRKVGTVIDPRRESLEDLERLKQQMTELFFSAQYQQEPIPLAGNIIKAEWFKEYEITPAYSNNDLLIISLDTAMKGTQLAGYSVATVWLARGDHSYLLDLWRERVDYPELRRAVSRLREKYAGAALLVEDKGSGTSLIQDLRAENRAVIGINPEGDKLTRTAKASARFEAGAVFFPKAAPWLSGLKAELLGFPNVRYDDQVDSVTQALAWIEKRTQSYGPIVCPVMVRVHNPYREAFPDYRDVPW
jgi:predicted phage terminase large subunit-like protein